jgi:hypothetical protein
MGRLIGQAFPATAQAQELHNHKLCEVPAQNLRRNVESR